ncbi:hypothetical protein M433DRAFT_130888 [Acidomyces richmondensis BFW]|nr:MAG: hypothetical protein FE78DRAFT_387949 [Acidomyces sp. 'richmondensis']KYG49890.1 hypothetical protein M433DRAFT_130888 [Acidomyces richmondensis BFW]
MEEILTSLTNQIISLASTHHPRQVLIGLAGPPGSGKSTIASALVLRLQRTIPSAIVLSLDGFHYSRAHLRSLPNAEAAFARRGAPWTFDVGALTEFVTRLRANADKPLEMRSPMKAPSFDHAVKDPVLHDILIAADTKVIILEHLYLLLDDDGWRELSDALDLKVMIDVDRATARERVARRHVRAGIERSLELGRRRYDENDGVNGELIRSRVVSYDVFVQSVDAEGDWLDSSEGGGYSPQMSSRTSVAE